MGIVLILVSTIGFSQWLANTPTMTVGPSDYWYFVTPLMVSDLYVGGTTGSNGTFYINGLTLTQVITNYNVLTNIVLELDGSGKVTNVVKQFGTIKVLQ